MSRQMKTIDMWSVGREETEYLKHFLKDVF